MSNIKVILASAVVIFTILFQCMDAKYIESKLMLIYYIIIHNYFESYFRNFL